MPDEATLTRYTITWTTMISGFAYSNRFFFKNIYKKSSNIFYILPSVISYFMHKRRKWKIMDIFVFLFGLWSSFLIFLVSIV
ncbi:hypothetical protein ACJX0J_029458, partial [Zea mays]